MAKINIELEDRGDGQFIATVVMNPPPDPEDVRTHASNLTPAQHAAVHMIEAVEEMASVKGIRSGKGADDPRYLL